MDQEAKDIYIESLEANVKRWQLKYHKLQEGKLAEYSAMAMQGLMANSLISTEDDYHHDIAQWAVKQAKALLAELEKEG